MFNFTLQPREGLVNIPPLPNRVDDIVSVDKDVAERDDLLEISDRLNQVWVVMAQSPDSLSDNLEVALDDLAQVAVLTERIECCSRCSVNEVLCCVPNISQEGRRLRPHKGADDFR